MASCSSDGPPLCAVWGGSPSEERVFVPCPGMGCIRPQNYVHPEPQDAAFGRRVFIDETEMALDGRGQPAPSAGRGPCEKPVAGADQRRGGRGRSEAAPPPGFGFRARSCCPRRKGGRFCRGRGGQRGARPWSQRQEPGPEGGPRAGHGRQKPLRRHGQGAPRWAHRPGQGRWSPEPWWRPERRLVSGPQRLCTGDGASPPACPRELHLDGGLSFTAAWAFSRNTRPRPHREPGSEGNGPEHGAPALTPDPCPAMGFRNLQNQPIVTTAGGTHPPDQRRQPSLPGA